MNSNVTSNQPALRVSLKMPVNQSSNHLGSSKSMQPMTAIKKIHNFSYALTDEIGLGLTSKVFKGKNDINGNIVAVKCISLNKNSQDYNQFLAQQINTLQKIKQHSATHLLKLEDVLITANNLYIVTQFCEGKDMGKILRQRKKLPQDQAQTIMKQMILGYKQLYSLGLIHRDLKLSNLFVTGNKIKIADFGFAISEDKCNNSFSYNAGSPKYMPPESLKYNKYSFQSDVWGMGVIAFQLVYGYTPWQSHDPSKLYDLCLSNPIQKLFDKETVVSDHYKNFILNCLKINIEKRPDKEFIFSYKWPLAGEFVQGYEQEKKTQEVIKVPGKNYAVYNSSTKQISYEQKQLDIEQISYDSSNQTQFVLLSQLSYCKFLMHIRKKLKDIQSSVGKTLIQEIQLTVQILMKSLGEVTCMQKNRFHLQNFDSYIKSGDWQNLRQLIIRYDLDFRSELQSSAHVGKNSSIPVTNVLPQTIKTLKNKVQQNCDLIDQLITYFEIRQIFGASSPYQFAEKVNMIEINKEVAILESQVNKEGLVKRVHQRLARAGL